MSKRVFAKLMKLNLKTVYFNFHYFSFKTALRLPVFISSNSKILNCKGKIEIKGKIKPGMIELGYGHVGNFDKGNSRFIWDVEGEVIFERNAFIGHGSRIRILESGKIFFGENFMTTAESSFISRKDIHIGKNCLFSWEILIMDTDFHSIFDVDGNIINPDRPVMIGDHVWIGCRTLILKGAFIPDNSVVAAGTTVANKLTGENQIFAGTPPTPIKKIGTWRL